MGGRSASGARRGRTPRAGSHRRRRACRRSRRPSRSGTRRSRARRAGSRCFGSRRMSVRRDRSLMRCSARRCPRREVRTPRRGRPRTGRPRSKQGRQVRRPGRNVRLNRPLRATRSADRSARDAYGELDGAANASAWRPSSATAVRPRPAEVTMKILVIEDDKRLAATVKRGPRAGGLRGRRGARRHRRPVDGHRAAATTRSSST